MDANQRASKLFDDCRGASKANAVPLIASEIRAVKAEAFEQAAQIAENGPPPGSIVHCDGDISDPGVVVTGLQKWIANRIRSLAKETEK